MKKLLLLAGVMMTCFSANAQTVTEPLIGADLVISALSPNGKYAASANMYGIISVINLETLEMEHFVPENEDEQYDLGLGANPMSNDGVVLVSLTYNGTPSYIEGGEIKTLPIPEGISSAFCNAITPDGSRIAGTIGIAMSLDAEQIMQRPVVWNRQADGTYAMPVELPYPKTDITGAVPQYVLVDGISADGKILACQLHDGRGFLDQLMVITENESGEWSYKMLADDLINAAQIEFPENPGESPEAETFMSDEEKAAYAQAQADAENLVQPQQTDFMSDEEKAAYQAAIDAYWADPYSNPYPFPSTYMTEEEQAAYNDAINDYYKKAYPKPTDFMSEENLAAYEAALATWSEAFDAYNNAYWQMQEIGTMFEMNSVAISPNGKYYVVGGYNMAEDLDEETWAINNKAYIFNLEDGTYTKKGAEGVYLVPTSVGNDGHVLAAKPMNYMMGDYETKAYYCAGADAQMVELQDYVKDNDPELYEWMKEAMFHEIEEYGWDEENEEDYVITKESWITGVPCSDAEMNTIATWAFNCFDLENEVYTFSYVLPMSKANEVATGITLGKKIDNALKVKMDADGVITLSGKADALAVYDINGRRVFVANNTGTTVQTGLGNGIYVVKAVSGNKISIAKVLK